MNTHKPIPYAIQYPSLDNLLAAIELVEKMIESTHVEEECIYNAIYLTGREASNNVQDIVRVYLDIIFGRHIFTDCKDVCYMLHAVLSYDYENGVFELAEEL